MKLNLKTGVSYALLCATTLFACKKNQVEFVPELGKPTLVLAGEITANTTLSPANDYVLKGKVFVKGNITLTIAAGTTILVDPADKPEDKGALIIARGAKMVVNGTVDKPVVFTSGAASKAPGDWAGIIVLGAAPTNGLGGVLHVNGMEQTPDTEFGGNDVASNSGNIEFLRLEYTGGLNPENEEEWAVDYASGLMLGGVGTGTTLKNVMVKHSRDDGFQFVGGTVDGTKLISYDNGDDNFDFDRGYTGRLQFIISYRPSASKTGIRANGIESLNDKDATESIPYTHPVISNMTVIGPGEDQLDTDQSQAIYIRRKTRFSIHNSIIAGYTYGGLMLCSKTKPLLVDEVTNGSQFRYNLIHADKPEWAFNYDEGSSGIIIYPDVEMPKWAIQSGTSYEKKKFNNNDLVTDPSTFMFASLYPGTGAPDFRPQFGSPAFKGTNFTATINNGMSVIRSFDKMEKVAFRGALDTSDTWANTGAWANWE